MSNLSIQFLYKEFMYVGEVAEKPCWVCEKMFLLRSQVGNTERSQDKKRAQKIADLDI